MVGPYKGTDPQNHWQQQATPVKYGFSDKLHALLSTHDYVGAQAYAYGMGI